MRSHRTRAAAGAITYYQMVLNDGATAYFKFSETSGASIADELGAYSGTVSGAYNLAAAGLAPGSDSAIDVTAAAITPGSSPLPGGESVFSIEWWMKATSTAPCYLVHRKNKDSIIYNYDAGKVSFFTAGGSGISTNNSKMSVPTDGASHHCVYSSDGARITGFVDGVKLVDFAQSVTLDVESFFAIGSSDNASSDPFSGTLDDIAIYRGVHLTPSQVAAHYEAER